MEILTLVSSRKRLSQVIPAKRLSHSVVEVFDEVIDFGFQVINRAKASAPDHFAGQGRSGKRVERTPGGMVAKRQTEELAVELSHDFEAYFTTAPEAMSQKRRQIPSIRNAKPGLETQNWYSE